MWNNLQEGRTLKQAGACSAAESMQLKDRMMKQALKLSALT
jgi:hypothetical protein